MQTLLFALDGEKVVTTTPGDPLGCIPLGAHRIGGGPPPCPCPTVRAAPVGREPLVGLVRHPLLGQHGARGVVQGRQEVRRRGLPQAGCAHGLAVHRDDCSSLDGAGRSAQPRPQTGVEVGGVQVLQHPPDGRLRRQGLPRLQAQGPQIRRGQVGGVLPDGRQAPAACEHSRHGQGQDREQAVAHAPPIPGVGDVPENLGQGLARQGRRGGG